MGHADEPFESSKQLISRSEEHFAEFLTLRKAFVDSNPCEEVRDIAPKTGDIIVKIKATRPAPGKLRSVISDYVNNLRHSLDHAVNDAAVLIRGGRRNCYFPFAQDAAGFATIFTCQRYKTIPIELREYLARIQPYFGGDDLLYALNRISGPNKHQFVVRAAPFSKDGFRAHNLDIAGDVSILNPVWDRAEGELPLFRLGDGAKVNYEISVAIDVMIDDPALPPTESAAEILQAFGDAARRVVGVIERSTRHILATKASNGASK